MKSLATAITEEFQPVTEGAKEIIDKNKIKVILDLANHAELTFNKHMTDDGPTPALEKVLKKLKPIIEPGDDPGLQIATYVNNALSKIALELANLSNVLDKVK